MLVKTEWHQVGRIIVQVYSGEVGYADMEQGYQSIVSLLETANQRLPVHLIVDYSQREGYAPELFRLPAMRQLFELSRQNSNPAAWLIAVQPAPNPVILFTSTLAARLTGQKFRVVGSLEEALRYLYFTDSSLAHPEKSPLD